MELILLIVIAVLVIVLLVLSLTKGNNQTQAEQLQIALRQQMQENRERPSHWNLEISSCLITIFIFTSQTVAIFMSQMIMESPRPNSGREKDMRIIMTARSGPGRNGSNFRLLYFIIGPLME